MHDDDNFWKKDAAYEDDAHTHGNFHPLFGASVLVNG